MRNIIAANGFAACPSGGLEALTCPQALKFIRCTNVEFTTVPAIAGKPMLPAYSLLFI